MELRSNYLRDHGIEEGLIDQLYYYLGPYLSTLLLLFFFKYVLLKLL